MWQRMALASLAPPMTAFEYIAVPLLVALLAALCVLGAAFIARVVGGLFSYDSALEPPRTPGLPFLKPYQLAFLNEPGTNWFWLVQQKYFDHTPESRVLWQSNLNEAGWSGERRR